MQKTVSVIVITFNRLELLEKVISGIKSQSYPIQKIFVINNGSSDGTEEWLHAQEGLTVITQGNSGSSGGQYTGFDSAFKSGSDWIWTMDDDVIPESDCLEQLMDIDDETIIRAPLRYSLDKKPYFNDTIKLNLSNPFSSIWDGILSEKDLTKDIIEAEGITFEGPLMHRSIVEKAGLPEYGFFIYGDDTEYFIRTKKLGAKTVIVKNARLNRQLPAPVDGVFDWKSFYLVRNIIAIDVIHGNLTVRLFRPIAYLISWLGKAKTWTDRKTVMNGFMKGYFYKTKK